MEYYSDEINRYKLLNIKQIKVLFELKVEMMGIKMSKLVNLQRCNPHFKSECLRSSTDKIITY